MSLNPCQEHAKTSLVKYILAQSDKNEIILTGGAGTGKTYTLKQVIEATDKAYELLKIAGSNKHPINWILTATTNKAKEALQERFPTWPVYTIHSILGLIPKSGKLVRKDTYCPRYLNDQTNVLVIDECSYIDPELMYFINEIPKNVKVIYLGDACQLTPVGHNQSPVFSKGIQTLELKQQMRQATSPLLNDYCQKLVAFIKSKGIDTQFPTLHLNDQLVHLDKPEFNELLHEVFITNGLSNKNHRVLSYSNKVVIEHNDRLFKSKEGRVEFEVGDVVINNHYIRGLATDAQVTIVTKQAISHPNYEGFIYGLGTNRTTVRGYVPNNLALAKATLSKKENHFTVKHTEQQLLSPIVDLRPMYACTVHKSQGSTFDTVYLDLTSFNHIKDDLALARLLYVALSRARTRVVMTGDIT